METKTFSVEGDEWSEFQNNVGRGGASEKLRELIASFNAQCRKARSPSEVPKENPTPGEILDNALSKDIKSETEKKVQKIRDELRELMQKELDKIKTEKEFQSGITVPKDTKEKPKE